jgi:hypothetical protein
MVYHASRLPLARIPYPPHHIYQTQQNRYFDQRAHSGCKSLITVGPIRSRRNSNRQLKVITRSSETLRGCQLVSKSKFVRDPQGGAEDGEKVDD